MVARGEPSDYDLHAEVVFNRIKDLYALDSDADLAELLEYDPSSISRQRRDNAVPYRRIVEKLRMDNLNYVFTGRDAPPTQRKARKVVVSARIPEGVDVEFEYEQV